MTGEQGHVVFVSQRFPPEKGGNASRIHDTTENLADDGWTVTVLAPTPCYPPGTFERRWSLVESESVADVTVHRLFTWQPTDDDPGLAQRLPYFLVFGVLATLWLLWHRRAYDAVVTSTPPISTGAPGLVWSLLGGPWLVDVRDLWIDNAVALGYLADGGLVESVSRLFQRTVLRRADSIAVTTPTLGDHLVDRYGNEIETKTFLAPNGVDVDRFVPGDEDDDPVVIYTGNLGRAQDLSTVVAAMDHVSHDGTKLELVGTGNAEPDLRALVRDRELDGSVTFTGPVDRDDVPDLLAAARIGVVPLKASDELDYAMPTKLYEYMASGLPAVVTGRGEIARFVRESGGGVHVDAEPEAVAAAIDDLLEDADLRADLGQKGRAHVREKYDRAHIADRLGTHLAALVDDSTGGRA